MKRVVFDCDGVILDFTKGFLDYYYRLKYNEIHNQNLVSRPNQWNFGWQGDVSVLCKLIDEFISTQPMLEILDPETPEVMKTLKSQGYHISIVTHYPDTDSRHRNLNLRGIYQNVHYDELHCVHSTEIKIAKIMEIRPQIYVEDANHIIEKFDIPDLDMTIYTPNAFPHLNVTYPTYLNIPVCRYVKLSEIMPDLESVS